MEVTHSLRPPAAGRTTGITTSAGTTSLSYDYEGRVTGITYPSSATNSFSYNGADARVGKVDSAGTSTYKRDGSNVLALVLSDGTAAYTPGVSRHASSATTFEGGDYEGTNRVETNSSQSETGTRLYDAFGNMESTTGTPAGPFGYVGQGWYQEDGDSGLKLLGHRYYDPSTGRFLSRDVTMNGRNWYQYADSSPNSESDPNGLQGEMFYEYPDFDWVDILDPLQPVPGGGLRRRGGKQLLGELMAFEAINEMNIKPFTRDIGSPSHLSFHQFGLKIDMRNPLYLSPNWTWSLSNVKLGKKGLGGEVEFLGKGL